MSNVPAQRERLLDLLADRALVGLDPVDAEELGRLLVDFPDVEILARDIELAAAAVALASLKVEPMPAHLFAKIEADAQDGMPTTIHKMVDLNSAAAAAIANRRASPDDVTTASSSVPVPPTTASPGVGDLPPGPPNALKQTVQMSGRPVLPDALLGRHAPPPTPAAGAPYPQQPQQPQQQPPPSYPQQAPQNVVPLRPMSSPQPGFAPKPRSGNWAWTGWALAAACFLLAVGAWYLRPRTQIVTVTVPAAPPSSVPAPPQPPPSLTAERESLLAKAGTARFEWKNNPKDPASKQASGDVVWNANEQKGYMRFRGLAKNDRNANVYQLWIFDKTRDDKYPVDGGVFEIEDESGDVIVPIKARLTVNEATLFAVTVEKPGGVVVSKRERLVVTAKPST